MAKIHGRQQQPQAPPRRRAVLPGWLPLAVLVAGFGIIFAPEETTWWLRVMGAVLVAGGAFWLGQDRQHDPADRTRISQLESMLVRLGVLDRELAVRRDVAQALGTQRRGAPAPPPQHGTDEPDDRGQPGDRERPRPQPLPDLDAPLPGE